MNDFGHDPDAALERIDTSVPHSARIWNYWLGGKDHFEADRIAGAEFVKTFPGIVDIARAARQFMRRSVSYLAGEEGVRQFLDIGTGLPTANNVHEVAQTVAPDSRIVYVDNDPLVLVHSRALLTSTPEGATDYIDSDLREPETILREAARTLDFGRPVMLNLNGTLGHIPDLDEAYAIIKKLMAALVPGSYLALNIGTRVEGEHLGEAIDDYNDTGADPYVLRTPSEVAGFFLGLELLDPGVVPVSLWRPDPTEIGTPRPVDSYGGVGRKTA